jgi:hypothetical protein
LDGERVVVRVHDLLLVPETDIDWVTVNDGSMEGVPEGLEVLELVLVPLLVTVAASVRETLGDKDGDHVMDNVCGDTDALVVTELEGVVVGVTPVTFTLIVLKAAL